MESEERYRVLVENIDIGITLIDRNHRIVMANPAVGRFFGKDNAAFIGKECFREFEKRDSVCPHCPGLPAMDQGRKTEIESEIVREDGSRFVARVQAFPILDDSGNPTGFIKVTEDVTDKKHTKRALVELEARSADLYDHSPDMYASVDVKTGVVLHCNRTLSERLGWSKQEIIGRSALEIHPPEEKEALEKTYKHFLETGIATDKEFQLKKKGGGRLAVSLNVSAVRNDAGEIQYGQCCWRDITERKRMEREREKLQDQLNRIQTMEAIGNLAGGIAHDFNNLLMGIFGRTALMKEDIEPSHPSYEHIDGIESAVRAAAELTKQLLGLGRGGKYQVVPSNLNELAEENLVLFGRTKKEIVISTEYDQGLWAVEVDQGQMEQVLLNLFVNAWQAMPGGGNSPLKPECDPDAQDPSSPISGHTPGLYVQIDVSDSGLGMDEKTRRRIFEPFFTTKEMGRGTGLGLASAYGIVKNHSGIIEV